MKKTILTIITVALLSACRSELMGQADGHILCDTTTRKAFIVIPGAGDTSFLEPLPSENSAILCEAAR